MNCFGWNDCWTLEQRPSPVKLGCLPQLLLQRPAVPPTHPTEVRKSSEQHPREQEVKAAGHSTAREARPFYMLAFLRLILGQVGVRPEVRSGE